MESYVTVDVLEYVSTQVKALKFSGIWFYIPHSKKSIKFWTSLFYQILVVVFVFIPSTVGNVIYLIKLMSGEAEIQEVAATINLVLIELLASFKLLDLFLRRHLFMQLLKLINNVKMNLISRASLHIVEKSIQFSRRLYMWLNIVSAFDIIVHVIIVPALDGFRTLPLKMDFLFFDNNEYFQYVFAYQILYKPIMVLAFTTIQSLSWSFMICAIGQLDVLIYELENMKELVKAAKSERNCDENEAFECIFKKCLQHHCVIKRYINNLQDGFGGHFTLNLALDACIICTTAVQIFSIESLLDNIVELLWVFLFLVACIIILFIDCFLGNEITIKSSAISTAVYKCPWVNLTPELKKNVVIFIAETQRPLIIRAGCKLIPVSLVTFTKVMDWTYKGFALMNQMKN